MITPSRSAQSFNDQTEVWFWARAVGVAGEHVVIGEIDEDTGFFFGFA